MDYSVQLKCPECGTDFEWRLDRTGMCPECGADALGTSVANQGLASKVGELRACVVGVVVGCSSFLAALVVADLATAGRLTGLRAGTAGLSATAFVFAAGAAYVAYRGMWRRLRMAETTKALRPGVYRVDLFVQRVTSFYIACMFLFIFNLAILYIYVGLVRWLTTGF